MAVVWCHLVANSALASQVTTLVFHFVSIWSKIVLRSIRIAVYSFSDGKRRCMIRGKRQWGKRGQIWSLRSRPTPCLLVSSPSINHTWVRVSDKPTSPMGLLGKRNWPELESLLILVSILLLSPRGHPEFYIAKMYRISGNMSLKICIFRYPFTFTVYCLWDTTITKLQAKYLTSKTTPIIKSFIWEKMIQFIENLALFCVSINSFLQNGDKYHKNEVSVTA